MGQKVTFVGYLLVITGIFVACNIYSLIPLYFAIGQEFGISARQISAGSSAFTICYAFGLLFFGTIAEKIGLKQIIVTGLVLAAATSFFVSTSENLETLILSRGLQGFTLASFAPVSFNYCFRIFFERKIRTFWIAFINAGFLCAGMVGQLISSGIMHVSWRSVYASYTLIYLVLACACFFLLPEVSTVNHYRHQVIKTMRQFRFILSNRCLIRLYGIVLTLLFAFVGFFEALGYYLIERSGDLQIIRLISLFGVLPAILAGILIDKWGARRLLQFGSLLALVSIGLILQVEMSFFIAIFAIFFVAAISLLIPALIEMIGTEAGVIKGKALALYSFTLLSGASLGSVVAALVSYHGLLFILLLSFITDFLFSVSRHSEINEKT